MKYEKKNVLTQPPPSKNFLVKMKRKKSCPKLAEMAKKLFRNNFRIFWPQPQKKFGQHEKNQSCPKLAEMARKLVKNIFRVFWPPQIGAKKMKVVPN